MTVKLIAKTIPVSKEYGETIREFIAYVARVSNPSNQHNHLTANKLLQYLEREGHWSPFEMASLTMEINTTRDIARQILRHRSFSFQEFCVAGDTKITLELPNGERKGKRSSYKRTIEHLYELQSKGKKLPSCVRVYDEKTKTFINSSIVEVFKTGLKPVFRVTLDNGKTIDTTEDHKFLTERGFQSLKDATGLSLIGNTASWQKEPAFACNGVIAHQDKDWLYNEKVKSIDNKTGLRGIANAAGVTTHTIRKWLKKHGIQYTKKEVSSYTQPWNKGLKWSRGKHSLESIEKMRKSARKGADSNLWRGGADRSERLKIADWCNAHRAEFLIGSNYKCNRCGSNKKLELHHIHAVVDRPDLAYEKSNIEVLCRECHRKHHNMNGDNRTWRAKSSGRKLTITWSKVVKIEYLGEKMTYDMEVDHESHNYVANGIVTHNSQRYAAVDGDPILRDCRLQDHKNRQNSIPTDDEMLSTTWAEIQRNTYNIAAHNYRTALEAGIAKEVARALLPEGLTPSRLYMAGTLRSWLHYVNVRTGNGTQREHIEIANKVNDILMKELWEQ